jgi:hypothetical protein
MGAANLNEMDCIPVSLSKLKGGGCDKVVSRLFFSAKEMDELSQL